MMADSKLTAFQRRQLEANMKAGAALPRTVDPTSSAPHRVPALGSAGGRSKSAGSAGPRSKKASVDKIQHRKPLAAIVSTGAYARPAYQAPQAGRDRMLQREQLADELTFGKDVAMAKQAIRERGVQPKPQQQHPQQPADAQGASSAGSGNVDLFDILVREIEERQDYLKQLQAGRHSPHEVAAVRTEISQRIRQLEMLDRERSKALSK